MEKVSSLIRVIPGCKCGDFNGPFSVLPVQGQEEYLGKYFDLFSKQAGFDPTSKAADEQEIDKVLKSIPFESFAFRHRNIISSCTHRVVDLGEYKYIRLFTDEIEIKDKTFLLKEKDAAPLPSFEVECRLPLSSLNLSFNVDDSYRSEMLGGVDVMTPGRTIEFKNGHKEIFRLGIYPNGYLYARVFGKDPYHLKSVSLGKFDYSKENSVSLRFDEKEIEIEYAGKVFEFKPNYDLKPTCFFAGSGLHGRFPWSIRIDSIVDGSGTEIDIFEKKDKGAVLKEESASIPSAFGGYEERGLSHELSFDFSAEEGKRQILNIDDIGPSATIKVNGVMVIKVENPQPVHIDVSSYCHIGPNRLRITLDPSAPENVASWHRHNDLYFGSFVGIISIDQVQPSYIKNVLIETEIAGSLIRFSSRTFINGEGELSLSICELDGREVESSTESIGGKLVTTFKGKAWYPEEPYLYKVIYRLFDGNSLIDEYEVITGFRTLAQKDGSLYCNDRKIVLEGALIMQYLPPYPEVPLNHVCPSFSQIVEQCLIAKGMNSNCLRMHQLGYGTNDSRFARACDYLGISLIWVTRSIDSVYGAVFGGKWHQAEIYKTQMKEVFNSPSIFVWEGANEFFLSKKEINSIYSEFFSAIRSIDSCRFISPVSHLYYGNDSYNRGCNYFQENGQEDEMFAPATACSAWSDSLTLRSAHTYAWLLGYGSSWDQLRTQPWSAQPFLLESKEHVYAITEYAIIGRQCPNVPEASSFFNNDSYEYGDERVLGYEFGDDRWELSQAYQSLAATFSTRKMLSMGVDGLLWCSLMGGANNGSYLKPLVDFYGHPKLAYYSMKECFANEVMFVDDTDLIWDNEHVVKPLIICKKPTGDLVDAALIIKNESGKEVTRLEYGSLKLNDYTIRLPEKKITITEPGYYQLIVQMNRKEKI